MNYRQEYEKWLASPALSEDERNELKAIANDEKEIENRFYGPLEFGTAGLRGTMYVGLHNMNRHVIRWATQGFANVIRAEGEEAMKKGVAICMDCRNHSMEFARAAACVMAGNGITVKLFESLRPTPELSFAVREYGCEAGINVTASHNPKEYNGYKVYWSDGAQLPPQHAAAIAKELEHIDIFTGVTSMDFDEAVNKGLITMLGEDCDKRFMANVMSMVNDYETVKKVADDFKLVYTPFHGCGHKLVPEALTRLGIKHLLCVPEQMVIDGNFPTVVSPNPENPEGFYLAIDLAKKNDVDFILGTDPDSDRVGIMVRNKQGEFEPVTGNQTGVLLLDYLIGAMKRAGKLPANAAALKTIVTTEMARAVAEANGLDCYDTFTGFKFMAEKMNELEGAGKNTVIFSYEESYGYMIGHYVRDKDAVTASLLLTEMAAWYYSQGMTLFDALNALFEKYGWYGEKTHKPRHAGPRRRGEDGRSYEVPARDATERDRGRQGRDVQGLFGWHRARRRKRRGHEDRALGLERAALRALRRHAHRRAPERHRAEDQGLHPHQGCGRAGARRKPRQILRLGQHPRLIFPNSTKAAEGGADHAPSFFYLCRHAAKGWFPLMAMLALYWSIMIACYLIASKLRRHADKFHFLDALTNLFIYFLIFLMGLRMGADEEVTSSLGSIGVQALFVTLLTAVGSMLGATAARKIVHLNRHSLPAGTEEEGAEEHGGGVNTTGIKSSVIIASWSSAGCCWAILSSRSSSRPSALKRSPATCSS